MLNQMISLDTLSAISSQALRAGRTLSDLQDGQTAALFGLSVAPANLSARQAKVMGLLTSGIYGPLPIGSSLSVDLGPSLGSRLQARMDSRGSTLFKLTWKERRTPAGRSISALRASVLRTSGRGYTGVPTPCSQDGTHGGPSQGTDRLPGCAGLSGVPTPCTPNGGRSMDPEAMSVTGVTLDGRKHTCSLEHVVKFSSVPTPTVHDADRDGQAKRPIGPEKHGSNLQDFVLLSSLNTLTSPVITNGHQAGNNRFVTSITSVATPAARDYKSNSSSEDFQEKQWDHPHGKPLSVQATLADSGQTATGGTGATKSTGQLNPEYSRWLMGFPEEWANSADMAMQSYRLSRQSSSKRARK